MHEWQSPWDVRLGVVRSVEGSNSSGESSSPSQGGLSSGTVSSVPPVSTSPPALLTDRDGIPSYAPSTTELFLRCPMLWLQTKRGLHPRVVPEWTPNQLVGSAIGLGLQYSYRQYDWAGDPLRTLPGALQAAYRALEGGWVDQETWSIPTLQKLVERGVKLALEGPQLTGMKSVVLNEQGVYGRRPDVVFRREDGGLVVDDNKVTLSLDARYKGERLEGYTRGWQIRDYAYHVGYYFEEPVVETRYHLIILGPRKEVVLHPVIVSQDNLARWYRSAQAVWMTMWAIEQGHKEAWQNLGVCTNKGVHFGHRCTLYDFCHVFDADVARAESLYEWLPSEGGER